MQIKVVPRLSKRPYLFKDAFIFLGGKYFMKVKCLDGKELEVQQNEAGLDLAKKISISLAKKII